MAPMAATVAGPEPETAAKNMHATTAAMPSPPGKSPATASERSVSFLEIPPLLMSVPARMKNGSASSVKESAVTIIFWATRIIARSMPPGIQREKTILLTPMETAMGTPTISRKNMEPKTASSMLRSSYPRASAGAKTLFRRARSGRISRCMIRTTRSPNATGPTTK